MDAPQESAAEIRDVPRKGDSFRVLDTEEIRGAGGLAVRDFSETGGVYKSGSIHMEDKNVRLPIGTQITLKQVFRDQGGTWAVFDYPYAGPNQAPKVLTVCALIEEGSTKYMEKVEQPTAASALDALRAEIEAARGAN